MPSFARGLSVPRYKDMRILLVMVSVAASSFKVKAIIAATWALPWNQRQHQQPAMMKPTPRSLVNQTSRSINKTSSDNGNRTKPSSVKVTSTTHTNKPSTSPTPIITTHKKPATPTTTHQPTTSRSPVVKVVTLHPTNIKTTPPSMQPSHQPTHHPSTSKPSTEQPTTSSPTSSPTTTCHDTKHYKSTINPNLQGCQHYQGQNCHAYLSVGFNITQVTDLLKHCPVSCNVTCEDYVYSSAAPSQAPSNKHYYLLTGSSVFFLATAPSAMDNETHAIFDALTWDYTSTFLDNAYIITSDINHGFVNLNSTVVLITEEDHYSTRLLRSAAAAERHRQLCETLRVNLTVTVEVKPSSPLYRSSTSSFDLLLSSVALSPGYMEALQRSDTFFSKTSIYSTYAAAAIQTNAAKQQQQQAQQNEANGYQANDDNHNKRNYVTAIALSVTSTLVCVVLLFVPLSFYYYRNQRRRKRFHFSSNDVFYASPSTNQQHHQHHSEASEGNKVIHQHASKFNSNDERSFETQVFSPYHSSFLNSTSTCKEADLISGSSQFTTSNNTMMYNSVPINELAGVATTTSQLGVVPTIIAIGNHEESSDLNNEHDEQFLFFPGTNSSSVEKQQQQSIIAHRNCKSSPCNSSICNSPATPAFSTSTANLEPNNNDTTIAATSQGVLTRLQLLFTRPTSSARNKICHPSKEKNEALMIADTGDVAARETSISSNALGQPQNSWEQKIPSLLVKNNFDNSKTPKASPTIADYDDIPYARSYTENYTQHPSFAPSLDSFDLESYYTKSSTKKSSRQRSFRTQQQQQHQSTDEFGDRNTIMAGYKYTFGAPIRGKLGLTIESSNSHGPTIRSVKDYSPLFGMVQSGDLIIKIEGLATNHLSTGEITELLTRFRKTKRDGSSVIHITLLSPIKKNGIPCDVEKVENIQARQDYLLENGAVMLDGGILMVDSSEESSSYSMPNNRKVGILALRDLQACGTNNTSSDDDDREEGVEGTLHLLGGLVSEGGSYNYDVEGQESLFDGGIDSLEEFSSSSMPDNRKVVILDERDLPAHDPTYASSDDDDEEEEEGVENTFHHLGGLGNVEESYNYYDEGQESL